MTAPSEYATAPPNPRRKSVSLTSPMIGSLQFSKAADPDRNCYKYQLQLISDHSNVML
jgi:hypothetical protein